MAGELEIPKGIKTTNAVPADAYYGPYANAAAACAAVPIGVRAKGIRKVGIIEAGGKVVDYWWPNAQGDADLVKYVPGDKTDLGLSNVDNTSDVNKPVSNAQQAAISAVYAQLIDGAPTDANTLNKLLVKIQALQALVNGDDVNLDSIKELADAIKAEGSTIAALTSSKVNIADIYNALDYTLAGKVLDARQGKALSDLILALQSSKMDTSAKATSAEANAETDDAKFITSARLGTWLTNVLSRALTWAAKQTFTSAPRFNSVTASQYLKSDANKDLTSVAAIPAADVTESTTKRFITDTERTTWNAKQNAMTAAVQADIQTGTDTAKFTTAKAVADFWTWVKTQAQTFSGIVTFSNKIKFVAYTNAAPADGDVNYTGTQFKARVGAQDTSFIMQHANPAFAGTTIRALHVNAAGDPVATNEIVDGIITDSDIITAITGATYNSGNGYKPVIAPANSKVFGAGLMYVPPASPYIYLAVADNTPARIPLG